MRNARVAKLQAGIKIVRRNLNILRYVDDTTLMAESEEKLKRLLMRVKEESERAGLKLNIRKTDHSIWPHYFTVNRRRKSGSSNRFPLLGL